MVGRRRRGPSGAAPTAPRNVFGEAPKGGGSCWCQGATRRRRAPAADSPAGRRRVRLSTQPRRGEIAPERRIGAGRLGRDAEPRGPGRRSADRRPRLHLAAPRRRKAEVDREGRRRDSSPPRRHAHHCGTGDQQQGHKRDPPGRDRSRGCRWWEGHSASAAAVAEAITVVSVGTAIHARPVADRGRRGHLQGAIAGRRGGRPVR